jgi:type 1 fimbriae regulatory protein FimB
MLNSLENIGEKNLKTDRTLPNSCSVASEIKKPRKRPKSVKYLDTKEIKALLGAIIDARDRAILCGVYHCGLRASEVKLLEISDYRQREGRLYVRRLKGSKSGEYRLFDEERRALDIWLKKRGTLAGPLFPSRKHRGISRRALDEL